MALKNIPTSRFARGFKLAKLTASVGAGALTDKLSSMFSDAETKDAGRLASQIKQAQKITQALSQMKGAAMKLGQILSMHGEHLFPKEVTDVLALLQQSSDEMEFSQIEKVLVSELGADYATRLKDLSQKPIASASIGQVHKALHAPSGRAVAVKVQYPGVDKSIDSDVDSLVSVFSMLAKIPNAQGFNAVTDEIKMILRQETDYLAEAEHLKYFVDYLADDEFLVLPRLIEGASTKRVLTTELVQGISVQEFAQSTASQAARDFLGRKYLEVFYRELFVSGHVQTDPNFANYKVQWAFGVQEPKLVLLDFGAVKVFDKEFQENYKAMMHACMKNDYDAIRACAVTLGFLRDDDSDELVRMHYDLVRLFMEPFEIEGEYDWANSDLAARIRKFMMRFIFAFKLRPPPRDIVFLDRKLVGVYFFCSAIGAKFNPRPFLEKFALG